MVIYLARSIQNIQSFQRGRVFRRDTRTCHFYISTTNNW